MSPWPWSPARRAASDVSSHSRWHAAGTTSPSIPVTSTRTLKQASALVRGLGRRCSVFEADFADETATAALLPAVLQAFGRLDSVVHNASLFVYDDVQTLSYANLAAHTCTNAGAAVLMARALHEHLNARKARGSLVLLLDQRLWNPNPDYLSYTLSKSALEMLTRLLAKALAPSLRVVGVAPGLTLGSSLIDDGQAGADVGTVADRKHDHDRADRRRGELRGTQRGAHRQHADGRCRLPPAADGAGLSVSVRCVALPRGPDSAAHSGAVVPPEQNQGRTGAAHMPLPSQTPCPL